MLRAAAIACAALLAGCAGVAGERGSPVRAAVLDLYGPAAPADVGGRTQEAALLTGAEGVRREGDVLTVDAPDGVQVRFVDAGTCEGFNTCRRWTYAGALRTPSGPYSVKRATKEPPGYASVELSHVLQHIVELNHGEGVEHWVVDGRSGTSVTLADRPLLSPDAALWAAGGCDDMSGCRFQLWRSGPHGPRLVFEAPEESDCCEVLGWDGPGALRVARYVPEGTPGAATRLERVGDGWVVRPSGALKELRLVPVRD